MTRALIQLTRLSYGYPSREAVLDNVDLQLHSGNRLALLGSNGAGKTTLLKIIMGLIKPSTGELMIFNKLRNKEQDFSEVRARIGFLFQDSDDQLFCPTVLEDVTFGPLNLGKSRDEAISIANQTLEELGLSGYGDRITHQLSGGEKRLIALAGVLAMQPEVLLLDEPSNALDDTARERLITILSNLQQSMIIISHDQDFLARLSNRQVTLADGKIIEQS
ncbi:MAG: energy-coupling factor ABC transporter ATP-binding protein [Chromatiales bacterium]|nr:energy-coupling factor ABC transporter ATP-binding protein [Chromatiales bacterium]